MAFRRCIISRTKPLYQEQRFSPSFSLINSRREDDEHDSPKKTSSNSTPSTRKIPSFLQSPIPASRFNRFNGFQKGSPSSAQFMNTMSYGSIVFGRSMSTGVDGGAAADKVEFMGDVAEVLSDGAIDNVVTQAAPGVSEVAAAAADSFFPVAAVQHFIDYVHTFTGFNWWASIAATTILIRFCTVPLLIHQLKATTKFTLLRPKLEEIKEEMQNRGMSPTAVAEGQTEMKKLFKEYGVTPFTPLKGLLIQGPVFICFFVAINNMVEKVPSFKEGGAFWFTDLTTPDSMYILPVLTGLTFWITVECNMQDGMEGNPAANTIKNVSRGFAVATVFLTSTFAKGIFFYWITANIFSLMYGSVIRNHAVKKALGIPIITPPPPSTSGQKPSLGFFEGIKKYAAAQAEMQRQQTLSSAAGGSKASSQQQPPATPVQQSLSQEQRIPSSSVLSQKIKSLERQVKGRKKGNKKR
ncbi:OLC1v1013088C1 [Oldenlandia corymbosa var. corymbosa]|uniref:OLC1v1013088C1 n=1 Tax=Oldenlandia corymbosa var. corymbosa TaxID=529605 RepID=A0AAV1E0R0_OLDCO|nr:OLC1v1013088C1 [Oldenlandia corymbosa var. corymbosa]